MKHLLLALALALQLDADILQREKAATQRYTAQDMVTIQAIHLDGTPAKGHTTCAGWWQKYDEHPTYGIGLAFETDSRGVTIFNPWVGQYPEGELMTCWSLDKHGHKGTNSWEMPSRYVQIIVR